MGRSKRILFDRLHGEHMNVPITVIVAPTAGRLHILPPRRFSGGREWVDEGQPVVVIEDGGSRSSDVRSPVGGRFGGVIGREGEPVAAGQPVAWVEPATEDGA